MFRDSVLENKFQSNGYVKIPLLKKEEVDQLIKIYHEYSETSDNQQGFHISLDQSDKNTVKKISSSVESILSDPVLDLLNNGQIFTSSFTVKEPGNQFIVPPHQDWTFVDEDNFCSATVWIPLQDVNTENGALGVIKGSHRLFNYHRSSPSPQAKSLLSDHIFTLFPYIDIINMKAGEALIFNNKLIHASPPNTSEYPRLAVGIGITQEKASLIHYYKTPGKNELEKYEVDKEFFYHYNNPKLSDLYKGGLSIEGYQKLETIPYTIPEWSKEEMEEKINTLPEAKVNEPLMKKLAVLFNYDYKDHSNYTANNNIDMETTKKNEVDHHEQQQQPDTEWKDPRSFFEKYTLSNIIAEIKWRLSGKK